MELKQLKANLRAEFEDILDFVTNEQAQSATADQIERGLFSLLLSLGAKLLLLFFQMRAQGCEREPVSRADGQQLPYHTEQKRTYLSVFGPMPLERPYHYKKGLGGATPLDAELSLGGDRYSDLLREMVDYLAVYVPSYEKGMTILERIFKFKISTRGVQKMVIEDATDVERYYEQKPAPTPSQEAEILVIQADGKGVPMVLETPYEPQVRLGKGQKRGKKKEAVVTTIYTIANHARTPQQVVDNLFHAQQQTSTPAQQPAKPQNKHVWATLDGKEAAFSRLAKQVLARQGDHIQHQVALTDGDPALQGQVETRFADFNLILDFIHPNEYLWDVANALFGETDPHRNLWVEAQTLLMLSSQTKRIIADFRTLAQAPDRTQRQQELLTKTANYFERNLPYMDYQTYLAQGWPIASGVIEGACRHFVKDRFELSGMRWTQAGAEQLLRLRAIAENDDWQDYHLFRRQQRHLRLYTSPFPEQDALEFQALTHHPVPPPHSNHNSAPSPTTIPSTSHAIALSTTPDHNLSDYFALPLAL